MDKVFMQHSSCTKTCAGRAGCSVTQTTCLLRDHWHTGGRWHKCCQLHINKYLCVLIKQHFCQTDPMIRSCIFPGNPFLISYLWLSFFYSAWLISAPSCSKYTFVTIVSLYLGICKCNCRRKLKVMFSPSPRYSQPEKRLPRA